MAGTEEQKFIFTPESGGGMFSFFGNKPGSYQSLAMRRKIAEQLAGQKKGFPKNIGEGLTYLGESIGEAGYLARLEAAEAARQGQLTTDYNRELGTPPAVATPAPAAQTSEVVTEAPVVTASAPPVTTTEPAAVTPPATTTAPPAPVVPPMNANPAAEQFRQQYLAKRGIAPTATNVPMPPPVQTAAAPLNADPAAEAFRERFLATRGNPLADPGPYQRGGPDTAAPIIPPTLEPPPPAAAVDVPLPRARPTASAEPPTSVADGGYNFMDAGADFRKHWKMGGVNPKLIETVIAGGQALPEGYTIRPYSGYRPGDKGYHGKGQAIDIEIVGPDGKAIPNQGPDKTGLYTRWARGAYTHALQNQPEIARQLGWGGAFDKLKRSAGVSNVQDLMHLDLGGDRGQLNPRNRLSVLGPLKDFNAPGAPPTMLAANPREQIAATLATRQMQPTGGVPNLEGSQQFGAGDTEAPYGYGPAVKQAAFTPAGAETVPDPAQEARVRDVIGLSRAGPRNPATASLGRQGIMSDAPLPGLAPLPSASDAGIAATIEQRNKITDELLNQQNAPTAPVVPQTDPTQPGTELSPTEAPSSSPTISPASPNARYAQASFADRFAQAPQAAIPPAVPTAPTPQPAAPRVVDIPVAPAGAGVRAPGEGPVPTPEGRPVTTRPLSDQYVEPAGNIKLPDPAPEQPEEKRAREILRRNPGDPDYAALAAEVAKPGIERRNRINAANMEAYKHRLSLDEKQRLELQKFKLGQPEADLKMEELRLKNEDARQKSALRDMWGGVEPAVILDPIKKSHEGIVKVPQAQAAVRNVISLVEDDKTMFTGAGADAQTMAAKLSKLLGRPVDPRAVNAETFKAYISSIVAQNRQMLAGNANISDPDMRAAVQASGGDITLERESILRIMRGIEKANALAVANHNRMLLQASGGDNTSNPNLQSSLYNIYGVDMEQVVPRGAVDTLRRLAADPDKADRAMSQFNKTFNYPGLAQRILRGG